MLIDQLTRARSKLRSDRVTLDGVDIAFWRQGTGPRHVVLVHGNSACKDVFALQFEALDSDQYSVFALDLPGHGESSDADNPDRQYTVPGYAAIVGHFIESQAIQRPVLVGWSLGGHTLIQLCAMSPSVSGLLITGTPPVGPGAEGLDRAFLPSKAAEMTMLERATMEQMLTYAEAVYGSLNPVPDWLMNAAVRTDGRARRIMGEHWVSGNEGYPQARFVAEAALPICVVHGANDEFVAGEYLNAVAFNHLWRNQIFTFEACGHAPFLEDPKNFNALLNDFCQEITCTSD